MGWHPLSLEEVDAVFPELKQEILEIRAKSRSMHKSHGEGEYEWGIGWGVSYPAVGGTIHDLLSGGFVDNRSERDKLGYLSAVLCCRWKFRKASCWSVDIPGPNGTTWERGQENWSDYYKGPGLDEFLAHWNLVE